MIERINFCVAITIHIFLQRYNWKILKYKYFFEIPMNINYRIFLYWLRSQISSCWPSFNFCNYEYKFNSIYSINLYQIQRMISSFNHLLIVQYMFIEKLFYSGIYSSIKWLIILFIFRRNEIFWNIRYLTSFKYQWFILNNYTVDVHILHVVIRQIYQKIVATFYVFMFMRIICNNLTALRNFLYPAVWDRWQTLI